MKTRAAAFSVVCALSLASLFDADAENAAPAPAVAKPTPALPSVDLAKLPPKERIEALKARLLKEAYDWHIYAEIGDLQMLLKHSREAAFSYERALAVYPLTSARSAEMKQAEYIAAQAQAEQMRQKLQKEQVEAQAQAAMLQGALQAVSVMPMGGSTGALAAQQGASAAAAMAGGISAYDAGMKAGDVYGILNPAMQVNYSLPEKQEVAGLWIKLGRAYADYDDHEKACSSFEQGMSIDPARFDGLFLLGVSLFEIGQPAKSLVTINRYLAGMPGTPPLALSLFAGRTLLALGMDKEAKAAFACAISAARKIVEGKPSDPQFWLLLGGVEFKAGEYQASLSDFKKAVELKPDYSDAMSGIAMCQMCLGDNAGLKELLPKMRASASDFDDWYFVARVEEWLGQDATAAYAKSVEFWEKAYPEVSRQPGLVASARAGAGDAGQGIALLREIIDRNPCAPDAYLDFYRLGIAYMQLKPNPRPDLAAEAFRQALEDCPNFLPAAVELDRLASHCSKYVADNLSRSEELLKSGEADKALSLMTDCWNLMVDGPERSRLFLNILKTANAMSSAPEVPREATDALLRGTSYLALQNTPENARRASFAFRHASNLAPWRSASFVSLALCHSATGRDDLARKDMEFALSLPSGRTQDNILKLYEYTQRRVDAVREYKDASVFK